MSPLIPYDYQLHKTIIYSVIAIFTVAGLFGNLNVILVYLRKPSLRSKYGILMCSLTICQTICLCSEWVGISHTITATIVYRSTCFYLLFTYVFFLCMQNGLIATISFDLLLSILKPLWYRKQLKYKYCALISIPTVSVAILSVSLGFGFLDEAELKMCNPPSSLNKVANGFYFNGALVTGGIVIVNYMLAYVVIVFKSRQYGSSLTIERRAIKSLSVILIVFIISRFIGIATTNFLMFLGADKNFTSLFQNYIGIFAVIVYSQNFYVIFWRSLEYRVYLKEQIILGLLVCFRNSQRLNSWLPKKGLFTTVSQSRIDRTTK